MICWYGLTSYPVLVPLVGQMGNQSSEGGWNILWPQGLRSGSWAHKGEGWNLGLGGSAGGIGCLVPFLQRLG